MILLIMRNPVPATLRKAVSGALLMRVCVLGMVGARCSPSGLGYLICAGLPCRLTHAACGGFELALRIDQEVCRSHHLLSRL